MKNIIMTGATSGLGRQAAKHLIKQGNNQLHIGYRSKILEGANNIPLDLSSFQSIKSFAKAIIKELGDERIDVLICNAGLSHPDNKHQTEDGLEMNIGVNHVGHFYLFQLLKDHYHVNTKFVFTTSGTIDPEKKTLMAAPKHAKVEWLAYPNRDKTLINDAVPSGNRAYSSSKMCNLLTAIKINQLGWEGIAFDPGVTPGTRLARNANVGLRAIALLLKIQFIRKALFPESNRMTDAGKALASLAQGEIAILPGKYVAVVVGKFGF